MQAPCPDPVHKAGSSPLWHDQQPEGQGQKAPEALSFGSEVDQLSQKPR